MGRRVNGSVTCHPDEHPGISRSPQCLPLPPAFPHCSLWLLSTQSRNLRAAAFGIRPAWFSCYKVPPAHPVTFLVQRCLGGPKQQNSRHVLPELAGNILLRSHCLGRNEVTDNPAHLPQVQARLPFQSLAETKALRASC